jgi:5-methylcytosine-specific restriction enzyme A
VAQWQHIACGTVVDAGKNPPANCTFCIASIVYGEELGWRRVGTAHREIPNDRLHRKRRGRSIPSGKRRRIYERDDYRCVSCGLDGRSDPAKLLTIDHRIPVSKGGTDADSNLQTMCGPCNTAKGDSLPT